MTPAEWLRWYYRTRDGFGAPGLNFVDSTGRIYGKECDACGYRTRHATNPGAWVCGRCGKNWPFEDVHIFKGEVQKPTVTDVFERQNADWIDVGVVLASLLEDPSFEWDMKLYIATCFGHGIDPRCDKEGNVKIPGLAVRFRRLWPDAPGPWGRTCLYERVSRAKGEWTIRLSRLGVSIS